jgi:hypothetical protein
MGITVNRIFWAFTDIIRIYSLFSYVSNNTACPATIMEVRRLDGHLRHPPSNLDNLCQFYWRSFRFTTYENARRDDGPPRIIKTYEYSGTRARTQAKMPS